MNSLHPTRRDLLRSLSLLTASTLVQSPKELLALDTPSPIRLMEGAQAAGLDFILRNGATGRKYQVETLAGGLGIIDCNNDGWPDIFCTNGASLPSLSKDSPQYANRLYRNNHDGTFTDVTLKAGLAGSGYSIGVAVGDYNNDGFEDLFVVGVHGNHLYRNNGDGSFTDVTEKAGLAGPGSLKRPAWTVAACWFDYDNDGHLDLLLSNYCDWEPGIDPICGGMASRARVYCHPDRYRAEPMQLYHNNGNGTFTEITAANGLPDLLGKGMGIALSDFADDGTPGLFIANDNARNLLLRFHNHRIEEISMEAGVAYNGDGRSISGMGADFGDIDGDGRTDIVMTGLHNETFELFLNKGNAIFEDGGRLSAFTSLSRKWSGWSCGLADLDNDGWLDFFVAGGGLDSDEAQSNCIFANHRGHFTDVTAQLGEGFAQPALHRGMAFADFDRDGRIDVLVSALNHPLELWWNRTPPRHWLELRLRGLASNRSAIGARILCHSGQSTQLREVKSSLGYASSSDLTTHFGLNDATSADLEIRWPSGKKQSLRNLKPNQYLEVHEEG